jgi:HD superfamily phosphodiesterase
MLKERYNMKNDRSDILETPSERNTGYFSIDNINEYITLSDIKEIRTQIRKVEDLFFDPHGIHGISHTKRVMFLLVILCNALKVSEANKNLLLLAGAIHDIGRTRNGVCTEHGEKSYKKAITNYILKDLNEEEDEILKYVVSNNCKSDTAIISSTNYGKKEIYMLYQIFKDADGLDRVRIGDLNRNYLRLGYSNKLADLASQLVALEIDIYLDHIESTLE